MGRVDAMACDVPKESPPIRFVDGQAKPAHHRRHRSGLFRRGSNIVLIQPETLEAGGFGDVESSELTTDLLPGSPALSHAKAPQNFPHALRTLGRLFKSVALERLGQRALPMPGKAIEM
ncbi:hypothetical protein ACFPOI_07315 [Nonomuraea angiospora]|uniref:hypothetical protein n=1 Tax=Nonomuraea angiospora TaxID=46172 RepID=UPI001CEF2B19|nr:hypothetical protein [Nonomuraea angiospora]